jgi:hypothetical protein
LRLNQEEELRFRLRSWQVNAGAELQRTTIVFIALSALLHKLETDWARDCDKVILRYCPVCKRIPSSATDAAARRRTISRSVSRLDWDPSRSLPWLRHDLHFPPAAIFASHALQFVGARADITATLGGTLLLGTSGAYVQRP